MPILCKLGLHRFKHKTTARRGTTVLRCKRCSKVRVRHKKR